MSIVFSTFKHLKQPISIKIPVSGYHYTNKLFLTEYQLYLHIQFDELPIC